MSDSSQLISLARSGDPSAIATLLEAHAEKVANRIRPQIGAQWQSMVQVDDVMQVTFLEAFLQFTKFTGEDERSLEAWLTRIAKNNLQDAIRGLQRDKRPPPSKRQHAAATEDTYISLVEQMGADTTTISSKAARDEVQRLMDKALGQLPEDYATVVRLYDLQGISGPEVGAQMGRSRGAIHMLRSRAHTQLREILGAESNFFTFAE
ncbi:MAG: RNA polymerase sigma factor [Planctomycetota bacterium]